MLNATRIYHSVDINLITAKEIFCEKTEQTKTTWTISKLEDDPRNLPRNPSNTPLASMEMSLFHSVADSSELLISRRFLPYGFYEVHARVEMKGVQDVFGSDSMFVKIVQTPWLEPAVNGGSFHTVPFGLVVRKKIFCSFSI